MGKVFKHSQPGAFGAEHRPVAGADSDSGSDLFNPIGGFFEDISETARATTLNFF